MDNPNDLSTVEPEPKIQATETINGKHIPVGTLEAFAEKIFGVRLEAKEGEYPVLPGGLLLGIEKFKTAGGKFYRLIWIGKGQAWLAAEDITPFRGKILAMASGEILATKTGAFFDEYTR